MPKAAARHLIGLLPLVIRLFSSLSFELLKRHELGELGNVIMHDDELLKNQVPVSQADELFAQYEQASSRRRAASDEFLAEVDTYRNDVHRDGNGITVQLLEGFFDEKWGKNEFVRSLAQQTQSLLGTFNQTSTLILSSVATMLMNLRLTHDVLAFEVIATPIRELSRPLDVEGRTSLEIARDGIDNFSKARIRLNENYIQALADARLLEIQAEATLRQATLLLQIRRKRIWDFRQKHLSVTWREIKSRAAREGGKSGKDEASDFIWEEIEAIIVDVLKEEAEAASQLKRFIRWGKAVYRLFGKKILNRSTNDTDLMTDLLFQLKKENRLLVALDTKLEQTSDAIEAIRINAKDNFSSQQVH